MQIKVGKLRQLIREASDNQHNAKAKQLARHVFDVAEDYVDSIVAGQPDKAKAAELQQAAPEVVALAKWMLSRREQKAELFAQLAKTAGDMADQSGFWKRPVFLNKQDYVDQMQTLLRRMQRSYVEIDK